MTTDTQQWITEQLRHAPKLEQTTARRIAHHLFEANQAGER